MKHYLYECAEPDSECESEEFLVEANDRFKCAVVSMTIDDFSPCLSCKAKTCDLMDGIKCSRSSEFERFKRIVEDAAPESDRIVSLYSVIRANTYVCDICGKIIFPDITTSGDEGYDVAKTFTEIRGGFGNKVVCNHVCSDCAEKATLKYDLILRK